MADELISEGEKDVLMDAVRQERIFTREGVRRQQEPTVHEYDFRRPHRLSVENMRVFQRVHTRAAESVSVMLTRLLGQGVTVTAAAVEEMPYRLFIDDAPELCYGVIINVDPLKERGLILLQVPMCMQLVDQLLGGPGDKIEATRPLTPIDQAVVDTGVTTFLRALQDSWAEYLDVKYSIHERRNEVRMLQLLPFAETVLVVRFELEGALGEAEIRMCLPIRPMKEMMEEGGAGGLAPDDEYDDQHRVNLTKSLDNVDLSVNAILGMADVSVNEILNLHPGQVLRLDRKTQQALDVTVNGNPLFTAKAGLHGRKKGLQIVSRMDSGDDT